MTFTGHWSLVTGCRNGVVALATVLLLGAVLSEIALAGIFVVYVSNNAGFGLRSSAAALAAAQSGIDDALLRLVRDKDYSSASYPLSIASGSSADVAVVPSSLCGSSVNPKTVTITSVGNVGLQRRRLQGIVSVHCGIGEVRMVSLQEIVAS